MDIKDVATMKDDDVREELKSHGITPHHKTGSDKLKELLISVMDGTYQNTEKTDTSVKVLTAAEAEAKLTKTQLAMRMQRIVVVPNDTALASHPGMIFTVGSSKVNKGRVVKKYVPFNNDEGWHVPQIIIDQINAAEVQKFRQTTNAKGEKIMVPYFAKKFNVQILPPLTKTEMAALAASQQAKHGIA